LTPYDVVEPHLACISEARMGIIGKNFMDGAPDLVVEILSPSTYDRDMGRKAALYAASDVLEYWIVDLEQQNVTVLSLVEGRYQELRPDWPMVRSLVLPEIRLNIPNLFASLH
jgi:Uma2 family endonuclease